MVEGTVEEVSEEEVKIALKKMKSGKTLGPTGLKNLQGVQTFIYNFMSKMSNKGPRLVVNRGMLEEVEQLCYLGDMLDCEAGVERAVQAKVTAAWRRRQEIASLLVSHSVGMRTKGRVYEACVRSALLYGEETWALTSRLVNALRRCDRRMPEYMAGVRWQERRSSSEVAEMCGVEDLSFKLRQRRLRAGVVGAVSKISAFRPQGP